MKEMEDELEESAIKDLRGNTLVLNGQEYHRPHKGGNRRLSRAMW